jgi:hypothetical protein
MISPLPLLLLELEEPVGLRIALAPLLVRLKVRTRRCVGSWWEEEVARREVGDEATWQWSPWMCRAVVKKRGEDE